MKLSVGLIALGAAIGLTSTLIQGCTTTSKTVVTNGQTNVVQTTTLDADRTAALVREILPVGVSVAVKQDPNSVAYFEAAEVVINAALDSGNYDAATLSDSLGKISVKELRTPEAEASIQAALGIYRAFFAKAVTDKVDQAAWVAPVLRAISDGIKAGLPTK